MPDLSLLTGDTAVSKLAASLLLVVLALVVQAAVRRSVLPHIAQTETRRRWIINLRNAVILLLVIGLASIWIEELRAFAAAVVAVAVALVVATKEFILCINGSLLRAATNAYSIGDRIEIGGHRGDVIDFTLLSTTLLEVGPARQYHLRTGRTIVVPNSKLLDSYVVNESTMKPFTVHVFSVPVKQDWERAEQILIQAANEESAPFLEQARRHMSRLEQEHGLEALPMTPRVHLQIPEAGKLNLLVRVPAPIGRQGSVEQAILRKFLQEFPGDSVSDEPEQADG